MRSLFKDFIPDSHYKKPFNNYGAKEEEALLKTLSIDGSKFSEDNITYEEEEVIVVVQPPLTEKAKEE